MKRILLAVAVLAGATLFLAYVLEKWPFGPKWVQIVTSEGEPIMRATLALQREGAEPDFWGTTHRGDGWLEIPRGKIHGDAEMRATAPGCALVRGPLPSGSRIELPPGLLVTLKVPGDFPLPRPPNFLKLKLAPADADDAWTLALADAVAPHDYWQQAWEDHDRDLHVDADTRSVSARLPRGGPWKVDWTIMHYETKHEDGHTEHRGSGGGPADAGIVIDVREAGEIPVPIASRALLKYLR
ncbi:MAG: hypothetical protein ACYTDU_13465 [Planctomycetota bacterium]|jgi:hypothetical protein